MLLFAKNITIYSYSTECHGSHCEPSFIYAEGAPKNWKMALRLRPRIVKHKVSLRFVALLHVFEDINKALDWLRRSIN